MLIHIGFGHSPCGILFRTRQAGLADPSAVALLKRLRKSREWLCALRVELLREYGIAVSASEGVQARTFDAETGRPVASQNCAVRKTDEAIETAPVNIHKTSRRKGKQVQPEVPQSACQVIVFTIYPPEFPAQAVLEWCRLRWQVALVSSSPSIRSRS